MFPRWRRSRRRRRTSGIWDGCLLSCCFRRSTIRRGPNPSPLVYRVGVWWQVVDDRRLAGGGRGGKRVSRETGLREKGRNADTPTAERPKWGQQATGSRQQATGGRGGGEGREASGERGGESDHPPSVPPWQGGRDPCAPRRNGVSRETGLREKSRNAEMGAGCASLFHVKHVCARSVSVIYTDKLRVIGRNIIGRKLV